MFLIHTILWIIVAVVLLVLLVGLFFRFAGCLIRGLIAVAAIIIIFNILSYIFHWF